MNAIMSIVVLLGGRASQVPPLLLNAFWKETFNRLTALQSLDV